MKIAKVKSVPVHTGWRKNWLFVRLETDDGVVGWGEAYTQYDRDRAVAAHVDELGRYLLGRDVFQIKNFTQIAYDDYAQRRGSLEFYSALSGIEQAMWDAVGKIVGQPVYRLLGGSCRDRIRVYANGWSYGLRTPAEFARAAEAVVRQGFTALKFDPLPKPWRTYVPKEHLRHAVSVLREVRTTVGPDIDLLIDNHRRLAPMHAVALAEAYAAFDPYWFEEPCVSENLNSVVEIRTRVKIPIVTGEALYTKAAFRPVFEKKAADIINPDVSSVGGILELKEIAAMAEPHLVAVSPHNYNSTLVALAATVHASAVMPNFIITEYFIPFAEIGGRLSREPMMPVNGFIALPTAPGLGIELDEDALARHPYAPFPQRALPAMYAVGGI